MDLGRRSGKSGILILDDIVIPYFRAVPKTFGELLAPWFTPKLNRMLELEASEEVEPGCISPLGVVYGSILSVSAALQSACRISWPPALRLSRPCGLYTFLSWYATRDCPSVDCGSRFTGWCHQTLVWGYSL